MHLVRFTRADIKILKDLWILFNLILNFTIGRERTFARRKTTFHHEIEPDKCANIINKLRTLSTEIK